MSPSKSNNNSKRNAVVPTETRLRQYATLLGSTGVAAGAFGAHGLKDILNKKPNGLDNWKTAVSYQLLHATVLLGLSALQQNQQLIKNANDTNDNKKATATIALANNNKNYSLCGSLITIGTLMFSGSIYCLCLEGVLVGLSKRLLGPITPIGGLLMISGWVLIGLQ